MKKVEVILNGEIVSKPILTDVELMCRKLEGEYIKIGSAYCPLFEVKNYDYDMDEWLKDKLN